VLSTLVAAAPAVVAVAVGVQALSPSDRELGPTPPNGKTANAALLVLDDASFRAASGDVAASEGREALLDARLHPRWP
jgi:hypothetical protein